MAVPAGLHAPRHAAIVRITHWITTLCFFALLVTGIEIVISHPRFYWGETGNVLTPALFALPIPASRSTVPTGYGFVLPAPNGWSRYLHFQAAWAAVLTGLVYAVFGLFTRHFRTNLLPAGADLSWRSISGSIANTYESLVVADAPEAYWRLNETNDGTGMIFDSMGRHDGATRSWGGQVDGGAGFNYSQPGALADNADTCILF